MTDTVTPTRRCGDCNACCTTMPVLELDKPGHTRCQHVSSRGCRIYADRPTSCRTWFCLWALGHVPRDWRPDKLGLVGTLLGDGSTWAFHALTPGTDIFKSVRVNPYLRALSAKGLTVACGDKNGFAYAFKNGAMYDVAPLPGEVMVK